MISFGDKIIFFSKYPIRVIQPFFGLDSDCIMGADEIQ